MAPHPNRPYDPHDYDHPSVKLDRFIDAARAQIGDTYRFGAEASEDDADPTAFDSSELVEWAAHRAGFHDMPDGSWNQYRYLHEQGAAISVDEALHTKGALVFGFSSDPLESADRPARAYVGISLGNGKILDVSERAGQVREMDPGNFYSYGAKIPEFHAVDDSLPPDTLWPDDGTTATIPGAYGPSQDQPTPQPAPQPDHGVSYGPDGRIIHEDLPAPEPGDPDYVGPSVSSPDDVEPNVCYPDEPEPEPDPQVCYPDDDNVGPTTLNEPAATPTPDLTSYPDAPAYADTSAYGDAATYADAGPADFTDTYSDPAADLSADV